jgi:hypothetical protein
MGDIETFYLEAEDTRPQLKKIKVCYLLGISDTYWPLIHDTCMEPAFRRLQKETSAPGITYSNISDMFICGIPSK